MIDDSNINEWLNRFFEGLTTCEEEKALFAYFRQERVLSSVEKYREMMLWYDNGMKMEESHKKIPHNKPHFLKKMYRYISVAASIVIIFMAGIYWFELKKQNQTLQEQYEIYYGSYVIENGEKNTDLSKILHEVKRGEALVDKVFNETMKQALDGVEDPIEREFIINMMSNN